jgi:simple sugar transport system substrate-binding protein
MYGVEDACKLTGCSYTWSGSQDGNVTDMVNAMGTVLDTHPDGIAVVVSDPRAFNALTNKALDAGIPVIAYNTSAPTGTGNNAMAYVGQSLYDAGTVAANEVLKYVKKGDLVAGFIMAPGALNVQPRIDGAQAVFKAAGVDFVQVATSTTQSTAISAVQSWYLGHRDVNFMYSVDSTSGQGVADVIKSYNLTSKGVHGSTFDLNSTIPTYLESGILAFTVDQQPYLQGFIPVQQLFMYLISGGLVHPATTDTGLAIVDKAGVHPYLAYTDRYEGTSTAAKYLPHTGSILT